MARKYNFKNLTSDQLEKIAAVYPKAVEIIRVPVYSQLRMIAECGAPLPEGIKLEATEEQEDEGQLSLAETQPPTHAAELQANAPRPPKGEKGHGPV